MPYLGNIPAVNFSTAAYQDLTGVTGSPAKRGFTLTHAAGSAQDIEVFVNNVRQEPSVAYTVAGTSLTMTGDVETTDDFYVVFQGKAQQTVKPADNSVTSAMISGLTTSSSGTVQADGDGTFSIGAGGAGYFQGENGVTGNSTNGLGDIFRVHEKQLDTSVTIAANNNALCAGPLTLATGVTLTITSGGSVVIA
tara:strand:+ start:501 stop:1082 length:582 start_codon:yes stop_codon:yes gene_type:complete